MTRGTKIRGVRIPDDLWAEVKTQAAREGIDASTLVRQLLRGWLDTNDMNNDKQGDGNE